jgi:hypothetical protein
MPIVPLRRERQTFLYLCSGLLIDCTGIALCPTRRNFPRRDGVGLTAPLIVVACQTGYNNSRPRQRRLKPSLFSGPLPGFKLDLGLELESPPPP